MGVFLGGANCDLVLFVRLVGVLTVDVVKYIEEMPPGYIISKLVLLAVCIPGCKFSIWMIASLIRILTVYPLFLN